VLVINHCLAYLLDATNHWVQILGSVGLPIPGTLVKVVDAETNRQVEPGVKGLVKARGPQVMKGYYKVRIYHTLKRSGFARLSFSDVCIFCCAPPMLVVYKKFDCRFGFIGVQLIS